MNLPPEAMGAAPANGNPMGNPQAAPQDPAKKTYGLKPDQINALRQDPDVVAVVRKFTGRDFPMAQIDDALIVQIAGMVHKLGVDGTVQKAEQILSPQQKATIRGIAMKQRVPMAPQGGM